MATGWMRAHHILYSEPTEYERVVYFNGRKYKAIKWDGTRARATIVEGTMIGYPWPVETIVWSNRAAGLSPATLVAANLLAVDPLRKGVHG